MATASAPAAAPSPTSRVPLVQRLAPAAATVVGLMRPEAWVLAGLYWLYLWPVSDWSRRVRLAGVVALAPLLWAGLDLYVTGDPLHSLHGTADLAEAVD